MRILFLLAAPMLHAQPAGFEQVRPILESACLPCHNAQKAQGGLRADSLSALTRGGTKGPAIIPGAPDKSLLFATIESPSNKPGAMPPGGPQLSAAQRAIIRNWIAAGAPWPANVTLGAKPGARPGEQAIAAQLHQRISQSPASPHTAYKLTIPNTTIAFEMVPIPGGEFTMGGDQPDAQPHHKVKLEPFWMARHEVTWDEYRLFMFSNLAGEKPGDDPATDAVSRPTRPYVEMSVGMGINGYPAISMTQHAANKYAQWLSARTGHFYRLPTEAEWEYACRAGASTAYSFGDSPAQLADYAWYADNSNGKYEKVGTKKPNPWGLHDMHGNVMEWTLDQYVPDFYAKSPALMPWAKATRPYPHSVRGGSWNDPAETLRCGARMASDPSWKMQDPQLPKSIWYHTDAQWLGFRLVRPVKVPTAEEMFHYWNNGVEKE
ncbi:MAG: SUMF1/EgtB/PvdO family nonheme iron enzyme [Bryobacteraceae bacterium]|nr:SUMF1/EgtB/PvdO family nonheme iron enzyme [Bryobacteraceae bacterium]